VTIAKIPETIPELIEYLELHNFNVNIVKFEMVSSPMAAFGIIHPVTVELTMNCYDKDDGKDEED